MMLFIVGRKIHSINNLDLKTIFNLNKIYLIEKMNFIIIKRLIKMILKNIQISIFQLNVQ